MGNEGETERDELISEAQHQSSSLRLGLAHSVADVCPQLGWNVQVLA